jgi:hypothetical protein
MTKAWPCAATLLSCAALAHAEDEPAIGYGSVAAALAALHANPDAQFDTQAGWIVAATTEHGKPVLWSFTPEGHPAHPAVVKRTAIEAQGMGSIELATLCQGPEA